MSRSQLIALDAIAHFAESRPQSAALIEPDGPTLSYKELWEQIEMLSCQLEEAGVIAGERVAVLLPQGALQVLAVAGVLNRHAVIPLQIKTTPAEVTASLRKLSVAALIAAPEFEAEADAAIGLGIIVLIARRGESQKDWEIRIPDLRSSLRSAPSEAVALFITSATTGASKIVPRNAANLNAGITSKCNSAQLTASDRLLLMIPQCFGVALRYAHAQFSLGGVVIATGGFDPTAYVSWLNKLRPTWYICAPAVHQAALAQLKSEPPSRPASLRFIESAFAPLSEEVRQELEQILEVPMLVLYGASEAGDIASESLCTGPHVPNRAGRSCGLEIGIMNSSGLLMPPGKEGEIAVRGPTVVTGYEDNPEATRAAFQDGWFRTGDAGRLDADGNLYVTGRLKEIINRGGEKIVPSEVDAVIASHPAVLDAAAFAVPHRTLGEDVACAVVLRGEKGPRVSPIELRRYAAQRLAPFKVPRHIRFVDQIPRGEIGKPLRRLLSERFGGTGAGQPKLSDPENRLSTLEVDDLQHQIRQIWARILSRDDVDLDEDFFEAGGDSLAAITMLAEVDQRLGCNTSASAAGFIDEPTIANLTTLVGKPAFSAPDFGGQSDIQIFPISTGGSSPPFYCVPANEDEGLYFRRLAKYLQGIMDVVIVRPANTLYGSGLFTFERAGEHAASLILREQHEGSYLVGGFCFGGIVASEVTRQLALHNRDVRLVLFDAPMPGPYTFLGYIRSRFGRGMRKGETAIDERLSRPAASIETSGQTDLPGASEFVRIPAYLRNRAVPTFWTRWRRVLWYLLVPLRRLLVPFEHTAFVQWLVRKSQEDYFPFFRARTINAPILHFLSADGMGTGAKGTGRAGTDGIDTGLNASRLRWRDVARGGIEERSIPLDHQRLLHESNLPEIANTLIQWASRNSAVSLNADVGR
jgi:acyl-CoA synthetase (AMP-forming)/AMP-acid ligase II/thioesterase domain-containing protein/acyl carrier protein